jgi:putative dimethyl sulfoxide reductase chaperone
MMEQYLAERAGLYSLLRTLYTYPLEEKLLAEVAGLVLPAAAPLSHPLAQMQAGLLAAARPEGNGHGATVADRLNVEMTRLLEGPGRTPAPPYASYYLHDGRLMGPPAMAARQTYLEWRAVPAGAVRLPDDHLALELGFMAYLAQLALESETERLLALAAGLGFLQQQLLPWLPRFCADLTAAATEPFFSGLAHFTQAAVQADAAWLSKFLQDSREQSGPEGVANARSLGG